MDLSNHRSFVYWQPLFSFINSAYEYTVPAHGKELVKTDLQIAVPENTYGRIAPRSGLAWKNHIDVGAGVIDADYRWVFKQPNYEL